MKKTPTCIRLIRIYFKTLKHCILRLLKISKPLIIFLLRICLWGSIFCIIGMFTNYSDERIPFWLLIAVYINIVIHHYSINRNYKDWEELAEYDEFNKEFCKQWSPNVLNYLFVYAFSAYYFNIFEFIIAIVFVYCIELWDRRYISNSIKLDLLLKNSKH